MTKNVFISGGATEEDNLFLDGQMCLECPDVQETNMMATLQIINMQYMKNWTQQNIKQLSGSTKERGPKLHNLLTQKKYLGDDPWI